MIRLAPRSRAATLLFSLLAAGPAIAQQQPTVTRAVNPPASSTVIPVDPKVKIGTLPNGLRYYIRQNPKPEKRAELRLVVNAGSILEDKDQLGLAHFIEHMGFNGTTHFQKNELVNYLQSVGVRFGADLNANTNFDETIFILPIPTDTPQIVERGIQILEDWSHEQLFVPQEVVNERGVVLEEWRGRQGAGERMLRQWLPIAMKGSLYADRLPIGTKESIEGATPDLLRRFYRDWYRPDLMAVIAVGDFDPARIEALIKEKFGVIPAATKPRPRPLAAVPDNKAPLVAVVSDSEATSSDVTVWFKLPHDQLRTVGDYRRSIVEQLALGMINTRFAEIAQKPNAPFLGAGADKGSFFGARTKDAFSLSAGVKDGGIIRGIEAMLTEAKRVDDFGFLESELSREKQDMMRGYERSYTERDKTNSSSYVREYINHYLDAEATPGIEYEYQLAQQLVPAITLADVNALIRGWITPENRVILATSPRKAGLAVPSQAEILAAFDRADKATVTAYTETLSGDALLATTPSAGSVVSEKSYPEIGVTEWKLSNGARVLVKPTDYKADEIVFRAYSMGGTSLVPDSNYMSAAFATNIVRLGGLGSFNRIDLGKKLSGIVANVAPSLSQTTEGLSGGASPKDLETLMQLTYLEFTAPRLDTTAFLAFKEQVAAQLANQDADPNGVFNDTIAVTMAQHHFRHRPLTPATFAEVDPAKAMSVFKDRFADAGDFTFLFVGNVSLPALKPLVEKYLASLPSTGQPERWRDVNDPPPTGVVERTLRKGVEPKAYTLLAFTGPFTYAPENRLAMRVLTEIFQTKLDETLREQLGGTYSPSVGGAGSYMPRSEYEIDVQFSSSPENADTLTKTTFALIDSMKMHGPSQADIDKEKEAIRREREVQTTQNAYWALQIAGRDQAGEDITGLMGAYDRMVQDLTPAMIQAAARQYFNTSNYMKFELLPER